MVFWRSIFFVLSDTHFIGDQAIALIGSLPCCQNKPIRGRGSFLDGNLIPFFGKIFIFNDTLFLMQYHGYLWWISIVSLLRMKNLEVLHIHFLVRINFFSSFISSARLTNLGFRGLIFTGSNMQFGMFRILERLDRGMGNSAWISEFSDF